MSWLYSRALVEEYSAANFLGGELSALLKLNPTVRAFLSKDKMTVFSRLSRFGMTFVPLGDLLGAGLLTWCLGAFRARTLALRGAGKESRAPVADSGAKWLGSLAKYDPVSCSWKTAQLSLLGDSELSSVTWPRSGMTQGGQCWELPMLGRRTSGTDCGLWLTPCAMDATPISGGNLYQTSTGTIRHRREDGRSSNRGLNTQVSPMGGNGGALNPTWVEWLMGWPLGWTDLKPLETDKYPCALPQPGESLANDERPVTKKG